MPYPERDVVELPQNFNSNERSLLLTWKNMEQETYIDSAMSPMDVAHEITFEHDPYAHVSRDRIKELQNEHGEFARRHHCKLFHEAVQKVPEREWTH